MSAEMSGLEGGRIEDARTGIREALEEIDVLKPEGVEAFVEAAKLLPGGAEDEEAGAGGLDVFGGERGVQVEGAVAAVDGVRGEETVEAQSLEDEGGGCREAAELEAELGLVGGGKQCTAGGGGAGRLLENPGENGGRGEQPGVGVEEQDGGGIGEFGEALIGGGGEAKVGRVGEEGDAGAGADLVEGGIRGGVVDDDDAGVEVAGVGEAGVQAGADVAGGVVRDDDGAGSHEATRK